MNKNLKRDAVILMTRAGWTAAEIAVALERSDRWVRAERQKATEAARGVERFAFALAQRLEDLQNAKTR